MIDVDIRRQNLLFGLASTFVLASLGTAAFRVRWHAEAGPTELVGWSIVTAAAVISLAFLTLDRYTDVEQDAYQEAFIGTLAGSAVVSVLPFALVERILTHHDPSIPVMRSFQILFAVILALSFAFAASIFKFVEDADTAGDGE